LSDKIEKAKGIVEAGKNIAALKEKKESLRKQLEGNLTIHGEAMKRAQEAADKEIAALKRTIAE